MTLEEFVDFANRAENGNKWLELLRGVVIERPLPTRRHGFVASRIGSLLWANAEARGGTYVTNGSCVLLRRDPDTLLRPDVAVFDDAAGFAELHPAFGEKPPLLAVVVVDLQATHGRLIRRIKGYLNAGTRLVWLVDDEMRCVIVYPRGNSLSVFEADAEITGEGALPGFRCPVSEFFRLPGQKPSASCSDPS